jgi:hypothetical protein
MSSAVSVHTFVELIADGAAFGRCAACAPRSISIWGIFKDIAGEGASANRNGWAVATRH